MKKLAILLVALLLALNVAALADYDQPILFRGIPWGASFTEISADIELKDLDTSITSGAESVLGFGKNLTFAKGTAYKSYFVEKPTVAGYPTEDVYLGFAAVPDADGRIPVDENGDRYVEPENTALFSAWYRISADDHDAAFQDLTNKLTSLYGDWQVRDSVSVWFGADGTMVSLQRLNGSLYVNYATYAGDEWLQTAQDALDREAEEAAEAEAFANNTEGL